MSSYPFYREIRPNIKKDFSKLSSYGLNLIDIEEAKKITDNYKFDKCEGKYVIVLDNWKNNYFMNQITNYFSEECRIHCKKYNKNKTPYELFLEVRNELNKKSKNKTEFRDRITELFWKERYICELFKVSIIRQLYMYFNAENILDFSAGWGDRLISAISLNKKYTGVDPSECMKPIYKEMITKLAKNKSRYRVINQPFEKVKLDEKYDFVFSSPPFFKLEVYEKDNIKQSIKQYPSLDKWKEGFLYVVIRKCYNSLISGGYFCIHVSDYKEIRYVNDMLDYIKKKTKFRYVGKFYYINEYDGGYSKPMFIRIFKKN
jgi:16S rRNA G966 N2-methylase RsmD